jgi:hypothetical protein
MSPFSSIQKHLGKYFRGSEPAPEQQTWAPPGYQGIPGPAGGITGTLHSGNWGLNYGFGPQIEAGDVIPMMTTKEAYERFPELFRQPGDAGIQIFKKY